jgi:hypothetical protein
VGAALRPSSLPLAPLRAKPLPRLVTLRHIQSETREPWRRRSRELLDLAMIESRACVLDVAEALAVDTRAAGRALTGEKPLDVGDLLALAAAGPGSLRLARRVLSQLRDEIDRIESASVR